MKLVYWDLPARSHFIRSILVYHGIDFEDERISLADGAIWVARKEELKSKILYPNLPYLENHGMFMTESLAIAKYVARTVVSSKEIEV